MSKVKICPGSLRQLSFLRVSLLTHDAKVIQHSQGCPQFQGCDPLFSYLYWASKVSILLKLVFPTISDTLFRLKPTTSAIFSWVQPRRFNRMIMMPPLATTGNHKPAPACHRLAQDTASILAYVAMAGRCHS